MTLRHSFAVHRLEAGVPLSEVQAELGVSRQRMLVYRRTVEARSEARREAQGWAPSA